MEYSFDVLNDKEFEVLCADLLSIVEQARFERFKPGKDSGVDGRYFTNDGREIVLQCKHWNGTPLRTLLRYLRKTELEKIRRLNPSRYLLAVSNKLSRADKTAIKDILEPYVASCDDIYGWEDLNDILSRNPDAERRHYKLWMRSSSVITNIFSNAIIGRSDFSLREMHEKSFKYVRTKDYERALDISENMGVVVIVGEPGVGKTTLAEQICLHYAAEGYRLFQLSDEMQEAEEIFDHDSKQVFYFDDFLGRNYLEALSGRESGAVMRFIRRVAANKNKRFILTSRSNILHQGKVLVDDFDNSNISKNEFRLTIKSLDDLDRAKILYSHIWFSRLPADYVDEIYRDRRYRQIISHKNFNPRLISFITDSIRLDGLSPSKYWPFILQSLSNPRQIWEHAFISQHDDFSRAIIILVAFGRGLTEEELRSAYSRYISMSSCASYQGRRDFSANAQILVGTFLNRSIARNDQVSYSLFNPSVGDYVIGRFGRDFGVLEDCIYCLRTVRILDTAKYFEKNGVISSRELTDLLLRVLSRIRASNIDQRSCGFLPKLAALIFESSVSGYSADFKSLVGMKELFNVIVSDDCDAFDDDYCGALSYGLQNGYVDPLDALVILASSVSELSDEEGIKAANRLAENLSSIDDDRLHEAIGAIRGRAITYLIDNFESVIDLDSVFWKFDADEFVSVECAVLNLIERKFEEYGLAPESWDAAEIVDAVDLKDIFRDFHRDSRDYIRRESTPPSIAASSLVDREIEELFERGGPPVAIPAE